jgi:hypothetical protein
VRRVKAFFYVALGILALSASFHLGARSAVGQTGPVLKWLAAGSELGLTSGLIAGDSNGRVWLSDNTYQHWSVLQQFPAPVVSGHPIELIALENGDVYWKSSSGYQFLTNIFGGQPVPVEKTTWGRLKASRR